MEYDTPGVDPEPQTPPACFQCTLVNTTVHNMPERTTKDVTPSAVTTHHADTKEDATKRLCEWCNNVRTDMIGYFLYAQGQTDRPMLNRINAGINTRVPGEH